MFSLPKLPYSYAALEPWFDARTMEIHHTKHHQAYINKLNQALEKFPEYRDRPLEELLGNLDKLPGALRNDVRNHGGGHYNHTLFWSVLRPAAQEMPQGDLAAALSSAFGSLDSFRKAFTDAAVGHFGSGWAWLVLDRDGALKVMATHDHDCPISEGLYPLYVLDLWEHAYYLQYQNQRAAFVEASWNVVNWAEVGRRFQTRERLISAA
jgi:superoxide dismutase, Fe-Mn family